MAAVKGKTWLGKIGGAAFVTQRGGTITINTEPIDITSKSSSEWRELLTGIRNAEISLTGVYDATDAQRTTALAAVVTTNTTASVSFTDGSTTFSFSAVITNIQVEAPHDGITTYSYTFQSAGTVGVA
jgi:TP901-1 family phage major tail protein